MKPIEELPSRDVIAIALLQVCRALAAEHFVRTPDESIKSAYEAYIKGLFDGYLNQAIDRCNGMSGTEISELVNQQLSAKDLKHD